MADGNQTTSYATTPRGISGDPTSDDAHLDGMQEPARASNPPTLSLDTIMARDRNNSEPISPLTCNFAAPRSSLAHDDVTLPSTGTNHQTNDSAESQHVRHDSQFSSHKKSFGTSTDDVPPVLSMPMDKPLPVPQMTTSNNEADRNQCLSSNARAPVSESNGARQLNVRENVARDKPSPRDLTRPPGARILRTIPAALILENEHDLELAEEVDRRIYNAKILFRADQVSRGIRVDEDIDDISLRDHEVDEAIETARKAIRRERAVLARRQYRQIKAQRKRTKVQEKAWARTERRQLTRPADEPILGREIHPLVEDAPGLPLLPFRERMRSFGEEMWETCTMATQPRIPM